MKNFISAFLSAAAALLFSTAAFADAALPPSERIAESVNAYTVEIICIAVAVIACIAGIIILARMRKKKNGSDLTDAAGAKEQEITEEDPEKKEDGNQ